MADVFISYSKADRSEVAKLAAFLEAQGMSVWWDDRLEAGGDFGRDIDVELAAARCVIVLWTEHSVRSQWVRAEALKAFDDGKLLPVKQPTVTYSVLPAPFNTLQTLDAGSHIAIHFAALKQVALTRTPRPSRIGFGAMLRFHALSWVGIVGGALTLLSNARALVPLSDLAHWIVTEWLRAVHTFWSGLLSWVGLTLPRQMSVLLTLIVSLGASTIGTKLRTGLPAEVEVGPLQANRDRMAARIKSKYAGSKRKFRRKLKQRIDEQYALSVARLFADVGPYKKWLLLLPLLMITALTLYPVHEELLRNIRDMLASTKGNACPFFKGRYVFFCLVTNIVARLIEPESWLAVVGVILIALLLYGLLLALVVNLMLRIAPAWPLAQRFWFVVFGFCVLLVLNELSKVGLSAVIDAWFSRVPR